MSASNTEPEQRQHLSETVSQSEVESHLVQVGGGDVSSSDVAPSADARQQRPSSAQTYHFREQSSLSANELRKLRLRHEEFIRSLAARLSVHLRLEVGLQMSKLETAHFQKFIEVVSNPTFLTMFQLEPLQGVCLLDIPPRLALCLVNRELGGPGQCLEEPRPPSEIETRLLSKIVEIIAGEWCSFWRDLLDLRPVLLGHESNGDFVRTCPLDTMMLILGIQVQVGEMCEQLQFCFPCATLESLLVKLNNDLKTVVQTVSSTNAIPKWNPLLDNIKTKVTVRLPNLGVTAREVAQLRPGNVLLLPNEMISQGEICFAGRPKFSASIGTRNQRWAAKIVDTLST